MECAIYAEIKDCMMVLVYVKSAMKEHHGI